ncbi:hypothetical protein HanOQP8_Chr08g0279601 [Helianthus annuus]|nr:hypothetical protein HanOQP8_Chr08g0279601 [Helianthus annuus]
MSGLLDRFTRPYLCWVIWVKIRVLLCWCLTVWKDMILFKRNYKLFHTCLPVHISIHIYCMYIFWG